MVGTWYIKNEKGRGGEGIVFVMRSCFFLIHAHFDPPSKLPHKRINGESGGKGESGENAFEMITFCFLASLLQC
jgi:hypothetical protein